MKNAFFLIVILMSCTQKKTVADPDQQIDSAAHLSTKTRMIKAADLKTGVGFSTPVISNAQKFILPVPAFQSGGEPLVYPKETPKAGQPILDYEGKPIGEKGIVFFNAKDKSWQAAAGDGQSVIIINEVTQEQAEKLHQEVEKRQSDPNKLTLAELKQVLTFAQEKLGLNDMYNSTRSFIREKMTAVLPDKAASKNEDEAYGFKKRDDRDVNQAIYIPGEFAFEGPAASPQKFENGGVIVEQGGKMRGVQPDIFVRTYKLSDGSPIRSVTQDIQSQELVHDVK